MVIAQYNRIARPCLLQKRYDKEIKHISITTQRFEKCMFTSEEKLHLAHRYLAWILIVEDDEHGLDSQAERGDRPGVGADARACGCAARRPPEATSKASRWRGERHRDGEVRHQSKAPGGRRRVLARGTRVRMRVRR